jgi:DNA replication protein DnaC
MEDSSRLCVRCREKLIIKQEGELILANINIVVPKVMKRIGCSDIDTEAIAHKIPKEINKLLPRDKVKNIMANNQPNSGFGLSGTAGCGKTMCMAFILKQYIIGYLKRDLPLNGEASLHYISAKWVSWPKFAEYIRSNFVRNQIKVLEEIEQTIHTKFLILDDLGAERRKDGYQEDFATSKLDEILDERYRRGLGTLYTTNLSPENLGEFYGARMMSRLMGRNPIIELPPLPDLRLKGTNV